MPSKFIVDVFRVTKTSDTIEGVGGRHETFIDAINALAARFNMTPGEVLERQGDVVGTSVKFPNIGGEGVTAIITSSPWNKSDYQQYQDRQNAKTAKTGIRRRLRSFWAKIGGTHA